ncbi:MAG: DUF4198 domain-containing protein [candidate division KSB1 bacterium]|nr:DUF4198 domain-containing protein [candidate division KSB1 bacterium]MDZ7364947.1 DUF4198 domain-containing protein [candidate division KSB1 bacterium]MDZ7403342.1 DUF4198 domain-containing protein [candidate division KSB1 bacterium]
MKKGLLAGLGVLTSVAALFAHDLFLKLETFFLKPHSPITVALFNGTFDKSENVITRDRMIDVSILGPQSRRIHPDTSQWRESGNVTWLDFKTGEAGTYILGVSIKARMLELSAKDFNDYLEHDGVLDVLATRKEKNELDKPARESYSKHVKTIFQVGDTRSDAFKERLNYPIEIVPLQNPYLLKPGDVLDVLILRDGNPLSHQLVYASYAGHHQHDGTSGHFEAVKTRTNENGLAQIKLGKAGKWYIRLIHMVPSDKEGVDYESNWATLTFEIKAAARK